MQETILDTGFATFPPRRVYLSSIQEIQMVLQTGYGNHLLLFHAVIYLMLGWCGETTQQCSPACDSGYAISCRSSMML